MKNKNHTTTVNSSPREKLLIVLDQFNLSASSFHALRSDAFEKHLAQRSLADLEHLYAILLDAGMGYRQMQAKCPHWTEGHQFGGQPPSLQTLCTIKHRLMADHTAMKHLNRLEKFADLLQTHTSEFAGEIPSTPLQPS